MIHFPSLWYQVTNQRPHWAPYYQLVQQYLVLPFSAGGRGEEDLEGTLGLRIDMGEQSRTAME